MRIHNVFTELEKREKQKVLQPLFEKLPVGDTYIFIIKPWDKEQWQFEVFTITSR